MNKMSLFGKTQPLKSEILIVSDKDYNLILCFCFVVCCCFLKPKWDVTFFILLSSLLV